jgi:transposase
MAFSAASGAPPSDSPGFRQREQTPEAGGALQRREVGEDPGAPLAAVWSLGGWWHSPASATARFVPSGVLHAKRCMMHAPSAGRRPPCKQLIMLSQTCRWDAPCTRRDSWREAVQAAGVQMSRATAYRRRPRMLEGGEAARHDRRQGHAIKVCGAVRTWLEGYCQHHPHASGKAVQALLEERCGVRVSVSVTHLNRVRAALTRATRRGKNQPGAWQDGAGDLLLLAAAAGSNLLPTLECDMAPTSALLSTPWSCDPRKADGLG